MKTLENKVVVITGGNGRVAMATAFRLANQGARIISLVRKDIDKAQENMSELPNSHLGHFAILASVKNTDEIKHAACIVKEHAGKCNILINAAGITAPTSSLDDETFDDIISTNLRGTFITIREFLDLLKVENDSLIINISSTAAVRPNRGHIAYVASKAGINAITQNLGKNLGPRIRVIGVSPGYLEHPLSGAKGKNDSSNKMAVEASALKKLIKDDDIAEVIENLAVSMKFITGQTIIVDGGITA